MLPAQALDLTRYASWTEASFPASVWADAPRPDNVVSRGPWLTRGKFSKRPTAEDIALVIEVSSTSRPKDRRKANVYARLRIPEYWLVDLLGAKVVVFRAERDVDAAQSYSWSREFQSGETLTSKRRRGIFRSTRASYPNSHTTGPDPGAAGERTTPKSNIHRRVGHAMSLRA